MLRLVSTTILTLLLSVNAAGAGANDQDDSQRADPAVAEFGSWVVVCDNGNRCSATRPPNVDSNHYDWLLVTTAAGPDPSVRVLVSTNVGRHADLSRGEGTLRLGSRPLLAKVISADDGTIYRGGARITYELDEPRTILARLVGGELLSVRLKEDGSYDWPIPTNDLALALRWIETRQGRLNTTTSIVSQGSLPASRIPRAPALPLAPLVNPGISQTGYGARGQRPPPALVRLFEHDYCPQVMTDQTDREVESARLDAQTELWSVLCALDYARRYYVSGIGGVRPRLIRFPSFGDTETAGGTDWLPYATYVPSRQAILPGVLGVPIDDVVYDPQLASEETKAWTEAGMEGPQPYHAFAVEVIDDLDDMNTEYEYTWNGREFVITRQTKNTGIPRMFWPTLYRTESR